MTDGPALVADNWRVAAGHLDLDVRGVSPVNFKMYACSVQIQRPLPLRNRLLETLQDSPLGLNEASSNVRGMWAVCETKVLFLFDDAQEPKIMRFFPLQSFPGPIPGLL